MKRRAELIDLRKALYAWIINVITFSHLFTTYILLIRLTEWMTMTLKCRRVALSQTLSNKIYDAILLR